MHSLEIIIAINAKGERSAVVGIYNGRLIPTIEAPGYGDGSLLTDHSAAIAPDVVSIPDNVDDYEQNSSMKKFR